MPRGKIKVRFFGGTLDGQLFENIDSRFARDEMHQETGVWTRDADDGQIRIMNGGNRDRNWNTYTIDIYQKGTQDSSGAHQYTFERSETIERCTATTVAGHRCMKACYKALSLCETHK